MTNTYNLNNPSSFFGSITRVLFMAVAAIAGFFMLAFSAAFALFVVIGIVLVGLVAFSFFWVRAKVLKKPFGPRAHFEAQAKKMQAEFGSQFTPPNTASGKTDQGPIIDAHKTPDGWSVDD